MANNTDVDLEYITNILTANKDKNFIDRVLNKDKYPVLQLDKNTIATHKMMWGESDGKYIVYPTIFLEGDKLKQYEPKEAFWKAQDTNNFIEFDNPIEADFFSRNYKAVWGEPIKY